LNMDIQKTIDDIKNFRVQGQTSITLAALAALAKSEGDLGEQTERLLAARPTVPMLRNCINFVLKNGRESIGEVERMIKEGSKKIIESGGELKRQKMKVLTYCHSSIVVLVLKNFKRKGVDLTVVSCETRPLFQGRITVRELVNAGIETMMVVDGAAGFLLSGGDFTGVFLGVDGLTDEYFYNKIGSYGVSLAADNVRVDLYLFGSLLKYTREPIEIEKRGADEIWKDKPKDLVILNLAFDKTPLAYVKGIVTEAGIIKPKDIGKVARANYPFLK